VISAVPPSMGYFIRAFMSKMGRGFAGTSTVAPRKTTSLLGLTLNTCDEQEDGHRTEQWRPDTLNVLVVVVVVVPPPALL